jgi:hypothetical protein
MKAGNCPKNWTQTTKVITRIGDFRHRITVLRHRKAGQDHEMIYSG